MTAWLALGVAAVVTFGTKVIPLVGEATTPAPWMRRASDMVGPALLGSLAACGVAAMATGTGGAAAAVGGLLGAAAAVRWRSVSATLAVGLAAYALVQLA